MDGQDVELNRQLSGLLEVSLACARTGTKWRCSNYFTHFFSGVPPHGHISALSWAPQHLLAARAVVAGFARWSFCIEITVSNLRSLPESPEEREAILSRRGGVPLNRQVEGELRESGLTAISSADQFQKQHNLIQRPAFNYPALR